MKETMNPAGSRSPIGLTAVIALIVMSVIFGSGVHTQPAMAQAVQRASAIVLVNSASAGFADFSNYIQPYLDHFGVPYEAVDITQADVPSDLGSYALIIIGHRQLDITRAYLSAAEDQMVASAVNNGAGLINFDTDLTDTNNNARYVFLQQVFNFNYGGTVNSNAVTIFANPSDAQYVVGMKPSNSSYTLDATIQAKSISLNSGVVLATLGNAPLLAAVRSGSGRALQWTNYDWMDVDVWGPLKSFDDLIWRGVVWAARKPFVMQGLPRFVVMRVDDGTGPYWWVDISNQYGFKPWVGYFLDDQDAQDAADLRRLANAGLLTASLHARSQNVFAYFNHGTGNLPDSTVAKNINDAIAFHSSNNIPISKFVVPHYYEIGSNVFGYLQTMGAEYFATMLRPGDIYYGNPTQYARPFAKSRASLLAAMQPEHLLRRFCQHSWSP